MIAARKGTEPGLQAHSGLLKISIRVCANLTGTLAGVVGTTNFVVRTAAILKKAGNGL